jgi:hypothetical protein
VEVPSAQWWAAGIDANTVGMPATHDEGPPMAWRTALGLTGSGLLSAAAVKFFTYPLDQRFFILAVAIIEGVWLLAGVVAVAGVIIVGVKHGVRSAVALGVTALLGLIGVVRSDLELGYPRAYFWTHRAEFATAAAFVETVPVDQYGYGGARLPGTAARLADGWADLGRSPNGHRAAVLWMSYTSGAGYGYAYAPSARPGEMVLLEQATPTAKASLSNGWWWVS